MRILSRGGLQRSCLWVAVQSTFHTSLCSSTSPLLFPPTLTLVPRRARLIAAHLPDIGAPRIWHPGASHPPSACRAELPSLAPSSDAYFDWYLGHTATSTYLVRTFPTVVHRKTAFSKLRRFEDAVDDTIEVTARNCRAADLRDDTRSDSRATYEWESTWCAVYRCSDRYIEWIGHCQFIRQRKRRRRAGQRARSACERWAIL